jgi:hypothetical protein
MTATFQVPAPAEPSVEPCMDAVAMALTVRVGTPNKPMKNVFTLTLVLATTALWAEPEVQDVPFGISMLTQRVEITVLAPG